VSEAETLVAIEHELAEGSADAYRRHLRDDAVVIVPSQVLDKEQTIAAVEASPGWDDFSIAEETVVLLGEDAALVTYRFDGRRSDLDYEALLSSAYVRSDGGWKLVFHQQTPVERTP
jgi:hypothetical protein